MFSAMLDGEKIYAEDAEKGLGYRCPLCQESVFLRHRPDGVRVPHFAHYKSNCVDSWSEDNSEWHAKILELFPKEAREAVLKKGKEIHRADVLIGNTVIELLHNKITKKDFFERNTFFKSFGYSVVWIVDGREAVEQKNLRCERKENEMVLCRWLNPPASIKEYNPQSDHNLRIWIDVSEGQEHFGQRLFSIVDTSYSYRSLRSLKCFWIRNKKVSLPELEDYSILSAYWSPSAMPETQAISSHNKIEVEPLPAESNTSLSCDVAVAPTQSKPISSKFSDINKENYPDADIFHYQTFIPNPLPCPKTGSGNERLKDCVFCPFKIAYDWKLESQDYLVAVACGYGREHKE